MNSKITELWLLNAGRGLFCYLRMNFMCLEVLDRKILPNRDFQRIKFLPDFRYRIDLIEMRRQGIPPDTKISWYPGLLINETNTRAGTRKTENFRFSTDSENRRPIGNSDFMKKSVQKNPSVDKDNQFRIAPVKHFNCVL